jgi:hypothetical protein
LEERAKRKDKLPIQKYQKSQDKLRSDHIFQRHQETSWRKKE